MADAHTGGPCGEGAPHDGFPAQELHRPVELADLLDGEELPIARLLDTAHRHDVLVGTFTDEELLLCGENPDAEPHRHWMPRLHARTADERAVALRAAVRVLDARGVLLDDDSDQPQLGQPQATLAARLRDPTTIVTWRVDVRADPPVTVLGGAFVGADQLVLHDDIEAAEGLHALVARPVEREAVWLAALLDPQGCATVTSDPTVAEGADVATLRAQVADLAGTAVSSTVLAVAAQSPRGSTERAATAYGAANGLWLFQGRSAADGTDEFAMLQRLGDADLLAATHALLGTENARRP